MSCESSYQFFEKPTKHVSVQDWRAQVNDIRLLSEDNRQRATVLRNDARQFRNEAIIASTWQRHETNNRLIDRIEEVREWLQLLENARRLLKQQSDLLSDEKHAAEMEIEQFYRNIGIVSECFFIRDHEILSDLSYDDPHKELSKESDLLENSRCELTKMCHEAWELITEGQTLLKRLQNTLNDKLATLDVDTQALETGKDNQHVGHKPSAEREPQEIIGHDAWIQENQSLSAESERVGSLSTKLRETMRLFRDQTRMSLLCQIETTNYVLRKRLYEANRLKNELEWQRKNALEEMNKLQIEIDRLRACDEHLDYTLKCAETRQENRNNRFIGELSRDSAHEGLIDEIIKLRQNLRDNREKTDSAICTYNKLENLVVQLDKEIECKALCIDTEMRAMDARKNALPRGSQDFRQEAVLGKLENQLAKDPAEC